MDDFVIRRIDTNNFTSMFLAANGKWTNTSEAALKMIWDKAEYIRSWYATKGAEGYYDLVIRKDSKIKEYADQLTKI